MDRSGASAELDQTHVAEYTMVGLPRRVARSGTDLTAPSENPSAMISPACDHVAMSLRASIIGPASTTTQAVVGSVVAFTLALLIGFGLKQGAESAVFTALLVGLAVLMISLKRRSTNRR